MNKEYFKRTFAASVEYLDLPDIEITRLFGASRPTIQRWKDGTNFPPPALGELVLDTLENLCTQKRIAWVNSLTLGDTVCNCNYDHLKIVEIMGEGPHDIQLKLEDGSYCSAMNCCDAIDHKWEH